MTPSTILVTGGCGYLGAELLDRFAHDEDLAGTTIRVLDNLQRGSQVALAGLTPRCRMELVEGDILDLSTLRLSLRKVDAVLHLAGVVTTPVTFVQDRSLEQINHWGTANLVAACLEAGVPRLIYASSAAVYGPGGPHAEDDSCRPVGSYAQTVYAAEGSVLGARDRGLDARVLRLGTLYGFSERMRFDNFMNRLALLAAMGKPVTVYGSGEQRRPILHVNDAADIICTGLRAEAHPSTLNVVESNPSILEIVEVLKQLKPTVTERFTGQDVLTHLSFEARNDLLLSTGWQACWSAARGLEDIVQRFHGIKAMSLTEPLGD